MPTLNQTVQAVDARGPRPAGLSDEPTGAVADDGQGAIDHVEGAVS